MVFTVLTLAQMAHVLAIRSENEPLWRLGFASNRPLEESIRWAVEHGFTRVDFNADIPVNYPGTFTPERVALIRDLAARPAGMDWNELEREPALGPQLGKLRGRGLVATRPF